MAYCKPPFPRLFPFNNFSLTRLHARAVAQKQSSLSLSGVITCPPARKRRLAIKRTVEAENVKSKNQVLHGNASSMPLLASQLRPSKPPRKNVYDWRPLQSVGSPKSPGLRCGRRTCMWGARSPKVMYISSGGAPPSQRHRRLLKIKSFGPVARWAQLLNASCWSSKSHAS